MKGRLSRECLAYGSGPFVYRSLTTPAPEKIFNEKIPEEKTMKLRLVQAMRLLDPELADEIERLM